MFCTFSLWTKWYKKKEKIKTGSIDRISTKQMIVTVIITAGIFWPYYGQNTDYVIIGVSNLTTLTMQEKHYWERKVVFHTEDLIEYGLKLAHNFVTDQTIFSKYKRQDLYWKCLHFLHISTWILQSLLKSNKISNTYIFSPFPTFTCPPALPCFHRFIIFR